MPLWIGSYLADTSRLNTEQHGAYLLIIMDYWRNGPPPDDDETLANITKQTPAAWRKNGPVIRRFFKAVDGVLRHKRVDEELASAQDRAEKAQSKAKAAADARWKKDRKQPTSKQPEQITKQSNKQCSEHAPSIASAELEQCPTPSPLPISPNGDNPVTTSLEERPFGQSQDCGVNLNGHEPTPAGVVCKTLKAMGIARVNPGNIVLKTLLQSGATLDEFTGLAEAASRKDDPFSWLLQTLTNQRTKAAEVAKGLHQGPIAAAKPPEPWWDAPKTVIATGEQLGCGTWSEDVWSSTGEQYLSYRLRVIQAAKAAGLETPPQGRAA